MNKVSKEVLYELYVIRGKPMHEIAKELDIAVGSVYNYMKQYKIDSRTSKESFKLLKDNGWEYPKSAKEKISKAHKGKIVSEETRRKMSYEGKIGGVGHKKKREDGYIAIYFPDHPKATMTDFYKVRECWQGNYPLSQKSTLKLKLERIRKTTRCRRNSLRSLRN